MINQQFTIINIPKKTFLLLLSVIVACYAIITTASIIDQELYAFLLKEDGPLENFATLSILVAALLFLFAYFKFRHKKILFFLLFSFAFFLLFMEEISWGQRIIGLETPEVFKEINAQKELNLHNYKPIYKFVNRVMYPALHLYLVWIPLLCLIFTRVHTLLLRFKIPLASPATALLMCINYLLFNDVFLFLSSRFGYMGTGKVNYVELYEAGIEVCLLYFAIECYVRGVSWLESSYDEF